MIHVRFRKMKCEKYDLKYATHKKPYSTDKRINIKY